MRTHRTSQAARLLPRQEGSFVLLLYLSRDRVRLYARCIAPEDLRPLLPGQLVGSITFPERPDEATLAKRLKELPLPTRGVRWTDADLAQLVEGRPITLAVGVMPRPAVAGHWRLLQAPLLRPARFRFDAPRLQPGETIAVWRPGLEGRAGVSALGEPLPQPSRDLRPVTYFPGEGIHVTNGRMVAQREGYLVSRRTIGGQVLSVVDLVRLPGESAASYNEGGGLFLLGGTQAVRLKLLGPLLVHGGVSDAELVTVGNELVVSGVVVRSRLAIRRPDKDEAFLQALERLRQEAGALVATVDEVLKEPAFSGYDLATYGVGRLIRLLLRHPKLAQVVPAAQAFADAAEHPAAQGIAQHLLKLLEPASLDGLRTTEPLRLILAELSALEERLTHPSRAPALHLACAENASLSHYGSVYVHGSGCYRSDVEAVNLFVPHGHVRGGSYRLRHLLLCRELGSSWQSETHVYAEDVRAEVVYPGVVLDIGGITRRITETLHEVRFFSQNGELIEESWKGGTRRAAS